MRRPVARTRRDGCVFRSRTGPRARAGAAIFAVRELAPPLLVRCMMNFVAASRRRIVAPGPRYRTPFAYLADVRRDPIGVLVEGQRVYGDVVRYRFAPGELGPFASFLFCRPEHVKHVLLDNAKNYWKGIGVGRMRIVLGDGLFLSEGDSWRRQRRLAQPAFHRQRIEAFVGVMTETVGDMLARWQPVACSDTPLDIADEMTVLTIAERRRQSHPGDDLLGMLLAAKDVDTGESMSDRQLRDELLTILGAGQETTAVLAGDGVPALPAPRGPESAARARRQLDASAAGPSVDDARRRHGVEATGTSAVHAGADFASARSGSRCA